MKSVRRALSRFRGSLDLNADDQALSREMESHLAIATEEFVQRGMTPADARRAALLEARGLTQAAEAYRDQRGIPLIESMRRNVALAVRALKRKPGYSGAIIASLALGIGLNTAIFSVIDAVIRRPLPYPDAMRIMTFGYTVTRPGESAETAWEVHNAFEAWDRNRHVGPIAHFASMTAVVQGEGAPEHVPGAYASSNLLAVLKTRPAIGRWVSSSDPVTSVVISDALWRRQFNAHPAVVGRSLTINGRTMTVIGVLPRGTGLPIGAEFWQRSSGMTGQPIARIPEGVSERTVISELETLAPFIQNWRKRGNNVSVIMMPLHDHLFGPARQPLRLVLGAALTLLLIACANVTNLVLARTLERRRELALRMAIGASARSLAWIVVLENALLTLTGGAVGIVLAFAASGALSSLAPPSIALARDIAMRPEALGFAIVLLVACCLVVSVAPVLDVVRRNAAELISQASVQAGRGRSMRTTRRALVVAQLALALALLMGTGLLIRSVERMTRPDRLGFSPSGVVILEAPLFGERYRVPGARQQFAARLVAGVRSIPGVEQASLGPPPAVGVRTVGGGIRDGLSMLASWTKPGEQNSRNIWFKVVDDHYLDTYRIHLRAGRGFRSTDDSSSAKVAIVNASAARLFFGGENAIGRSLPRTLLSRDGSSSREVIGVVGDALQMDIALEANPEVLIPLGQYPVAPPTTIAVRTSLPASAMLAPLNRLLRNLDPGLAAARLQPMDAVVDASLARHHFVLRLLTLFAALGLTLAAVGLYAVVSYLVTQRTNEIGVRMALGARPLDVVRLIVGEGFGMVVIGIAVAIPATLVAGPLIGDLLFETRPTDVPTFAVGAALLAVVGVLAAYGPARRASLVDPARTLRAD